jgi:hypothetical protein
MNSKIVLVYDKMPYVYYMETLGKGRQYPITGSWVSSTDWMLLEIKRFPSHQMNTPRDQTRSFHTPLQTPSIQHTTPTTELNNNVPQRQTTIVNGPFHP